MRTLLDRIIQFALGACLGTMTCVVVTSVVFRYVLNKPLVWPEELASMLFAWLTFVGAYAALRSRSHITINILLILLPQNVRLVLARIVDVGVLLLVALFAYQGFSLTITTWGLEYPAMEISRGYLYLSLPVGACLMAFAIIQEWRGHGLQASPEEERL